MPGNAALHRKPAHYGLPGAVLHRKPPILPHGADPHRKPTRACHPVPGWKPGRGRGGSAPQTALSAPQASLLRIPNRPLRTANRRVAARRDGPGLGNAAGGGIRPALMHGKPTHPHRRPPRPARQSIPPAPQTSPPEPSSV